MPEYAAAVVVIPAHNEVANLPSCLEAVLAAAACMSAPVSVVVVLDSTSDESEALAGRFGCDTHFLSVEARNVGAARAAGFTFARSLRGTTGPVWYATTDADSQVDPDWLVRQLRADAEMVLGVVRVADWRRVPIPVIHRYLRSYHARIGTGGHDHVHGANMGFSADAYWRTGGFRALSTGEDVDLVDRFEAAGLRVHRDSTLTVTTSARPRGRAPRGFAAHLRSLSRRSRNAVAQDSA